MSPSQLDAAVSGPAAGDAAAQHTGGIIGLPLSDVAAALLRRLYAEMQASTRLHTFCSVLVVSPDRCHDSLAAESGS